ncbi:cytochrome P450, partial [Streptomyces alkaliphilus]
AFSHPVPTRVICDLFGVPDAQRPRMLRVIDSVLDTTADTERATRIRDELYTAMTTLIETKRTTPGPDLTSTLLTARDDGDRLDKTELLSTLILMIGAGSETAVALINHLTHTLLTHPDHLATLRAHPERWPDAIEETLRLHPPIHYLPMRYATRDIDLGQGVTLTRGDLVLIGFGAHGLDPQTNPDPHRFDIDRADRQHLAFGHGIHYCLGAPLARLEAHIAVPALLARFPHLRLHNPREIRRQPSFIGNDLQALPVLLR